MDNHQPINNPTLSQLSLSEAAKVLSITKRALCYRLKKNRSQAFNNSYWQSRRKTNIKDNLMGEHRKRQKVSRIKSTLGFNFLYNNKGTIK